MRTGRHRLTHLERWQTDKCRNVRWIQTDKHRQTDLGIQQAKKDRNREDREGRTHTHTQEEKEKHREK